MTEQELRAKAARIKLVLMDVDGVMTNGHLYNFPDCRRQDDGTIGLRFPGWNRAAMAKLVRHQDGID